MGLRRSPTIDHDTSVWPLHVPADNRDRACNRDRGHSRDRGHIDRDYRTPGPDWVLSNDQALVLETPGRLVREWVHFRGLICVLGRVIAPLLRTPQAETPQQPRLHKSVRVCEPFLVLLSLLADQRLSTYTTVHPSPLFRAWQRT
jgi:hypothetical protein